MLSVYPKVCTNSQQGGGGEVLRRLIFEYQVINEQSAVVDQDAALQDKQSKRLLSLRKFGYERIPGFVVLDFLSKVIRFIGLYSPILDKSRLHVAHTFPEAFILSLLRYDFKFFYHGVGCFSDFFSDINGYATAKSNIRLLHVMEAFVHKRALEIGVPSRAAYTNVITSNAMITPREFTVIYNTVPELNNLKFNPETSRDILIVSTLNKDKGVDISLQILNDLFTTGTIKTATVVGVGPESAAVEALAKKHQGLEFINKRIQRKEILNLMHQHKYFLMQHRVSCFDLVHLEAVSQGCCLLLSKVGGNAELLGDKGDFIQSSLDAEHVIKMDRYSLWSKQVKFITELLDSDRYPQKQRKFHQI